MRLKLVAVFTTALWLAPMAFGLGQTSAAEPAADAGTSPAEHRVPPPQPVAAARGPAYAEKPSVETNSAPQQAATATAVAKWINDLGSDSYSVREVASGRLLQAGRSAIESITGATQRDDLEVTTRAVQILAAMLKSDDVDTADAAADALTKISTTRNASTAAMAAAGAAVDALVDYQGRTLEMIQRLGGEVEIGVPYTINPDGIQVTLGSNWHSGLKILKHVPNLEHLSLHGFPLSDDELADLADLRRLKNLDLFSTHVTLDAADKFERSHPSIHVDRRNAMLGIGVEPGTCQVSRVEPNSAADHAGLIVGDVILKFQGQAIKNFTDLTARIGACRGGDKVAIQISRGGQIFDREVTLGDWK